MIETHITENTIRITLIIIRKTTIRVRYKTEKMSKLTVTLMNCQRSGFR